MDRKKIYKELDNIWYHYKPQILVGVFFSVIAIFFIFSMVTNGTKESALNVVFTGNQVDKITQENFQQSAREKIVENSGSDKESQVKTEFWPVNGSLLNSQNVAQQEKMFAMITTGDIDVLILDKDSFSAFASQGLFLNLYEINEKLSSEKLEFSMGKIKGKDEKQHPYGIRIGENKRLEELGYYSGNKVLAIIPNSKRIDAAVKFINWLIKP